MRGQVLLEELVRRDDVEVAALCDIEKFMLDRALKEVAEAGKPAPRIFTGSDQAWREMLAKARLDGVIIATPWEWHAPMAIDAMKARVGSAARSSPVSRSTITGTCCAPSSPPARPTCCSKMSATGRSEETT